MSKFSPDVIESISSCHTSGSSLSFGDLDINYISNEAYLIRLHQRVISTVDNYRRIQAQWVALIRHALYLENVQQAEITQQFCRVEKGVRWSQSFNKLQYCWHVILKRPLCKVLGWISVFLTLIVMWSECTFFIIHPQLSIAAILVHAASRGYHYIYIEACTTLIIFYLCVCAYYTVFRLKIYRYYHLDAHHMTNENSLLFSAILLCRLTPPICLNVLGMIHMDSHITSDAKFGVETQFTMLMGHLDIIPILAEGINIYLPIFIVILCLGTWLRIGTRFLHSLGIEQFFVKDEMTAELIQGGKALVSLERNKIGRASEREKRDQYWAERFARKADASSFDLRNQSLHRSDNEIMSDERRMPLQVREYSDREPIISADEHEEYTTRDGVMHWRHNEMSAFRPPTNMFDDL
ncbi:hypothetical protein AB6A40_005967 [Gnathostoma spinigerum]|uniref:LMBR1 domain-containing protein 2 n=1 Tax=Gnathostoma spinigerum TaxID=75299 RepID=A0ABD6EQH5_9BILA